MKTITPLEILIQAVMVSLIKLFIYFFFFFFILPLFFPISIKFSLLSVWFVFSDYKNVYVFIYLRYLCLYLYIHLLMFVSSRASNNICLLFCKMHKCTFYYHVYVSDIPQAVIFSIANCVSTYYIS